LKQSQDLCVLKKLALVCKWHCNCSSSVSIGTYMHAAINMCGAAGDNYTILPKWKGGNYTRSGAFNVSGIEVGWLYVYHCTIMNCPLYLYARPLSVYMNMHAWPPSTCTAAMRDRHQGTVDSHTPCHAWPLSLSLSLPCIL
jgi:hypothetical protein